MKTKVVETKAAMKNSSAGIKKRSCWTNAGIKKRS
jgi:hypothetical protein